MNYVITSTLPEQYGGRTKSLLDRTKKLVEQADMSYTIITTNYNPYYGEIYEQYYSQNKVPRSVKMINIYDYLANRSYSGNKVEQPIEEEGLTYREVKKNKAYRFFENGEYVLYKNYDTEDGSLKFIDFMDPYNRKRACRKEFNSLGKCHRKINYKQGTTNKLEEIYYDDAGNAYVNKTFDGSNESKLIRMHLFSGQDILEFKTEKDFFRYCLEHMIEDGSTIINDARLLDKPLCEMKGNDVTKIAILHNTHLQSEDIHDVKSSYQYLIEHADDVDHIVALTHEQKKDLSHHIFNNEKISIIPHSIAPSTKNKSVQKQNKFVFIGRLTDVKQPDHLIEAYQMAREQLSDFTLDIYGEGPVKEKLEEQIKEYKLENHVTLKGLTDDPEGVFASAKASFLPSQYEGFGLVIMESLNNGCPVVAYDIKYGPRDLVKDHENGLIVEKNNIEALSKAMVQVKDMDFGTIDVEKEFREEAFVSNWSALLGKQQKKFKLPFFN
ncbi:glycosyltransferase [Guptibacillus sedimenti]|uniref:glycosyltransferase n=1 Tax=Guptibacillus sedimenti TaxID=3025680 RepID=UPI002361237F|nr:glycosyltransferase [Pseudalkalibacillus sedimenti]